MSPEAQRIAIAEACGWTHIAIRPGLPEVARLAGSPTAAMLAAGWAARAFVPNYLNDLNAMHEAEKVLTDLQHQHYYAALELVCSGIPYDSNGWYGAGWLYRTATATAAQRTEAFLRTIGKWEDGR